MSESLSLDVYTELLKAAANISLEAVLNLAFTCRSAYAAYQGSEKSLLEASLRLITDHREDFYEYSILVANNEPDVPKETDPQYDHKRILRSACELYPRIAFFAKYFWAVSTVALGTHRETSSKWMKCCLPWIATAFSFILGEEGPQPSVWDYFGLSHIETSSAFPRRWLCTVERECMRAMAGTYVGMFEDEEEPPVRYEVAQFALHKRHWKLCGTILGVWGENAESNKFKKVGDRSRNVLRFTKLYRGTWASRRAIMKEYEEIHSREIKELMASTDWIYSIERQPICKRPRISGVSSSASVGIPTDLCMHYPFCRN